MRTTFVTALGLVSALTVHADVLQEQRFDFEAAGMLSMLGSSGTTRSLLSGDKARSETVAKSKSKVMSMFAGDLSSADITRLDRGLIWQLDPARKEYTELTFEQLRQQMAAGMARVEEAQASMQGSGAGSGTAGLPVEESNCVWEDPKMEVIKGAQTANIAGLDTRQATVSYSQTCRDPQSGKACEINWTLEQWLASDAPGSAEAQQFALAYARALGLEEFVAAGAASQGQALMSLFGNGWSEVAKNAAELQGLPMKTVMEVRVGGEQCTLDNGQSVASADVFSNAVVDAQNAAIDQAAVETGTAVGDATAQAMGDSIGGRIGGAAITELGKGIASGIFGALKKTKPEPASQPAAAASNGPKAVRLVRMVTETTRFSTAPIDPGSFEIDSSWKKVAGPG